MKMLMRHYEGGLYRVLVKEGKHIESMEVLVCYESMEDGEIWLMPKCDFHSMVKLADGTKVPRFEEVEEVEESYWDDDEDYNFMKNVY